jgi:predicted RNA-binding Zn-ribbon protein involved in translation (DUF1610 family)
MLKMYHMADILVFLPIPPHGGKASFYAYCPHCGDTNGSRKSRRLNINLAKDVFRCARCGWAGGMFDLYAGFTGTPREKVREELDRLHGNGHTPPRSLACRNNAQPRATEPHIADIDLRHAVYNAMLSMLTLAPDHTQNLIRRGLGKDFVFANRYRTRPIAGSPDIARQLISEGHALAGIPGFYKTYAKQWTFAIGKRGILIPVRDIKGRIQGLQIRRDDSYGRKYRWLSSAEADGTDGCGAEAWTHLAGAPQKCVILTEGPLKADITHCLTGETALAVPGINSIKHLEKALTGLVELGLEKIMTAFDMDFLRNPHVKEGYQKIVDLLDKMGIRFGTFLWDPEFNGLDDFLASEHGAHRRFSNGSC